MGCSRNRRAELPLIAAVWAVCICVAALNIWENRALIIKDSCARSHDSLHNNDKWLKHSAKLHHMTETFRTSSLMVERFSTEQNKRLTSQGTFRNYFSFFFSNLILFFYFLSCIRNRDTDKLWRLYLGSPPPWYHSQSASNTKTTIS